MIQSTNSSHSKSWKSILAILAAAGGLLWHVLACSESPMSFSPDGNDLAFTTIDERKETHGDGKKQERVIGRLMVLSQKKEWRTIEESEDCILTGPAYSPDGKSLCYLKIPILPEENNKKWKAECQRRQDARETEKPNSDDSLSDFSGFTGDLPEVNEAEAASFLPPTRSTLECLNTLAFAPRIPAILTIRDGRTHALVKQAVVKLSVTEEPNIDSYCSYLTCRLQYSPDSKWIYIPSNLAITAVNPESLESRMIGGAASVRISDHTFTTSGVLSPDGKTIAVLLHDETSVLAFYQTNGDAARYRRLDLEVSPNSPSWKDKNTLIFLGSSKSDGVRLYFIDSIKLEVTRNSEALPEDLFKGEKTDQPSGIGDMAISPDGNTLVVCSEFGALFLNTKGDILNQYSCPEKAKLVRPTFSRDGRQLAFKKIGKGKDFAESIVFLTPEGAFEAEVPIPALAATAKPEQREPEK